MKIFGHRKREADDVAWSLDERFLFEMLLRVVPDQVYFKDVRSRFLCVSPTATRANVLKALSFGGQLVRAGRIGGGFVVVFQHSASCVRRSS